MTMAAIPMALVSTMMVDALVPMTMPLMQVLGMMADCRVVTAAAATPILTATTVGQRPTVEGMAVTAALMTRLTIDGPTPREHRAATAHGLRGRTVLSPVAEIGVMPMLMAVTAGCTITMLVMEPLPPARPIDVTDAPADVWTPLGEGRSDVT
jgi:hypothetical protein